MKKILGLIFWLLIIVLVGAYFGRNFIAKNAIEMGVKSSTGLDLNVGKVNIDLKNTEVGINDLKVNNPRGFKDPLMFNAPEIFVNFKLSDLLKKKLYLSEVRLNIDKLVIIKDKDGTLNLSALQIKGKDQGTATEKGPTPETKKAPASIENIQIDLVKLKIGKLIYKDYSKGEPPTVKEINVNINDTLTDIANLRSLALIIFQRAMAKAAISDLIGIDLGKMDPEIQKQVQGAMDAVGKIFGKNAN